MHQRKAPTRWLKSDVEYGVFLFEVDEDGWVVREIEYGVPGEAVRCGSVIACDFETEGVSDAPVSDWNREFRYREISEDAFEAEWEVARAQIVGDTT